jgi:multicomponent Na+:H+ antiporter subunit E
MVRRGILTLGLLVLIWWILAGTLVDAWVAGALAVALGFLTHRLLGGGRRQAPRISRLPAFIPYFAWQSVQGGWDVARRSMTPTLPLAPDLMAHPLSLPPGPSRVFFTNALSLLPGTFGADLRGDVLMVHLLVGGPGARARVRELERRVARLFGVEEEV